MDNMQPSCTVAPPRACNHATRPLNNETGHATRMQPTSLKALALKVLSRNRTCNQDATKPENLCNYTPEKDGQKLHKVSTKINHLLAEVGASITTENGSHVLKFNPFLAGPQVDLERWTKAIELEDLFFKQNTENRHETVIYTFGVSG